MKISFVLYIIDNNTGSLTFKKIFFKNSESRENSGQKLGPWVPIQTRSAWPPTNHLFSLGLSVPFWESLLGSTRPTPDPEGDIRAARPAHSNRFSHAQVIPRAQGAGAAGWENWCWEAELQAGPELLTTALHGLPLERERGKASPPRNVRQPVYKQGASLGSPIMLGGCCEQAERLGGNGRVGRPDLTILSLTFRSWI